MDLRQAKEVMAIAPRIRNYGRGPQIVTLSHYIYSYSTCVAVYDEGVIYVPVYHSTTTTRHINIIAKEWNADVVKLY